MDTNRRAFLKSTAAGTALALAPGAAVAQETLFSTIEFGLEYDIERGRENPINLRFIAPPRPVAPPLENRIDYGNLIIKVNAAIKFREDGMIWPNFTRLWLFKPRASVTDLSSLFVPPLYTGFTMPGDDILRYPSGNSTFPLKENSRLWQEYVHPNWEVVPGAQLTMRRQDEASAEGQAADWPGTRASIGYDFGITGGEPSPSPPAVTPLRVTRQGIPAEGELLLTLFEVRRYGRLRLRAQPILVKPTITAGICVAAAVATPMMSADLDRLRSWRDRRLKTTSAGRMIERAYYRASPPAAALAKRHHGIRQALQSMVSLAVRVLRIGDRKMR